MNKKLVYTVVFALAILNAFFASAQTAIKEYRVVAILPLTGQNASLGKNMLGAVQLALKDLKADNFDLVAVDAEGSAEQIMNSIESASPNAIIGPAHSADTKKLLPYIKNIDTCVISFSNDRELASRGGCLALMGFMPEESAKKVTIYASSQGYKIYALLPKSQYGKIVNESLQTYNKLGSVNLADVEMYDPAHPDSLKAAVDSIKYRIGSELDSSKTAIFIPENAVLNKVMPMLGAIPSKLLGSSQWEDQRLYLDTSLQGAWFATAPTKYRDMFEERFKANYDAKPLKISALAYDAMAFVYAMVRGSESHTVKRVDLMDPSGFEGITGMFRFLKDGSNERDLSIFEIREGKIVELESREQ